jgi:hypothetical protein
MTEKPPEDEPGAQERFDRGIANALKTPPKPHKPKDASPRRELDRFTLRVCLA